MAGETINKPSSWISLLAAESVANQAFSTASSAISASVLTADEKEYPLIDIKVTTSVGTPVENGTIDIYKRCAADGAALAPAGSYKQEYVGSVISSNALGIMYLRGVVNDDPAATYYAFNNNGATLTFAISARTRGWTQAA